MLCFWFCCRLIVARSVPYYYSEPGQDDSDYEYDHPSVLAYKVHILSLVFFLHPFKERLESYIWGYQLQRYVAG